MKTLLRWGCHLAAEYVFSVPRDLVSRRYIQGPSSEAAVVETVVRIGPRRIPAVFECHSDRIGLACDHDSRDGVSEIYRVTLVHNVHRTCGNSRVSTDESTGGGTGIIFPALAVLLAKEIGDLWEWIGDTLADFKIEVRNR